MTTNRKRRPWWALGCLVGVAGLAAVIAWPNYKQAAANRAEIDSLRERAAGYTYETEIIRQLADDVLRTQAELDRLKEIPRTRDMASLSRRLSLPADDVNVRDQAFVMGRVQEAAPGEGYTVQAASLNIEQEGRFDSIFAVLRMAESMDQLLRVRALRVQQAAGQELALGSPLLTATIEIDVLFDNGDIDP